MDSYCGAQGIEIPPHGLKRFQAHQAGEGQGQLGQHRPPCTATNPPPSTSRRLTAIAMSSSFGADHADVVAVMADRGGERAPAEAEAFDESPADIAVAAVALEHADLEQIMLRDRRAAAIAIRQIGLQTLGEDLARDDADHRRRRP